MKRRQLGFRTIVGFLLGVVVAGAATAGAASLITGKQIQDGSITASDLAKSVRTTLKKAGTPGPQGVAGPQGAPGTPGPQGLQGPKGDSGPVTGDLPSGATLRGIYAVSTPDGLADVWEPISYELRLASEPTVIIVPIGGPKPAQCQGTIYMPEAAPGHLCIYRQFENQLSLANVFRLAIATNPDDTGAGADLSNRHGALISFTPTGSGAHLARGSWAVTAP